MCHRRALFYKSIAYTYIQGICLTSRAYVVSFSHNIITLPHMPILGSSNSAANKDTMSKIWPIGIQSPD